jgi:hypothetical protein
LTDVNLAPDHEHFSRGNDVTLALRELVWLGCGFRDHRVVDIESHGIAGNFDFANIAV